LAIELDTVRVRQTYRRNHVTYGSGKSKLFTGEQQCVAILNLCLAKRRLLAPILGSAHGRRDST
jgi:hypothetical protein